MIPKRNKLLKLEIFKVPNNTILVTQGLAKVIKWHWIRMVLNGALSAFAERNERKGERLNKGRAI